MQNVRRMDARGTGLVAVSRILTVVHMMANDRVECVMFGIVMQFCTVPSYASALH